MASAVTVQKIGSREFVQTFGHKPNSAAATVVTPDQGTTKEWVDLLPYETFLVQACNHTLTGNGITLIEIIAAKDSAGTLNVTVVAASAVLTGTAVANGGSLEIKGDQLREVEAAAGLNPSTLRYVAGRITMANSADTGAVTYIRSGAKFPVQNLTPLTF